MDAADSADILYVDRTLLKQQIVSIMSAWGMSAEQVAASAEVMIETDTYGIDSHGVSMLMLYEKMLSSGTINPVAKPHLVKESAVTALLDGDAGLGHLVAKKGMSIAIEKCRTSGIGAVSVFNSHHFGAAGIYAKMAADAGLIGLVTSSARGVFVTPTFSRKPVLGTNPIAFAAPAGTGRPFLLDMSTSVVASNKVKVFDLCNRSLPSGWVCDDTGRFVTDAHEARDMLLNKEKRAGLAPLGGDRQHGGHKGYGLAMMVQILSSTLSGGGFSPFQDRSLSKGEPDNIGHFFLAINPECFRLDGQFEDQVACLMEYLHGVDPVDPAQPVLVAGDPEFDTYEQRLRTGIPLPGSLLALLRDIARRASVPFLID